MTVPYFKYGRVFTELIIISVNYKLPWMAVALQEFWHLCFHIFLGNHYSYWVFTTLMMVHLRTQHYLWGLRSQVCEFNDDNTAKPVVFCWNSGSVVFISTTEMFYHPFNPLNYQCRDWNPENFISSLSNIIFYQTYFFELHTIRVVLGIWVCNLIYPNCLKSIVLQ